MDEFDAACRKVVADLQLLKKLMNEPDLKSEFRNIEEQIATVNSHILYYKKDLLGYEGDLLDEV